MRTLTTLALVVLLALPVAASNCSELEITQRDAGGPIVSAHTPGEGVWTSIVGQFLWVHYEEPEAGLEYETAVSVNVGDAIGATVCPDGTVTLHLAEAVEVDETSAEASETDTTEVVDLPAVYADFQPLIDALLAFRPY